MTINFNNMLYAISYALDCVEQELLGVATHHSKRVAYLCSVLGKRLGLGDSEVIDLVACAILHDNALTQYIDAEYGAKAIDAVDNKKLGIHCAMGEANIKAIPFCGQVDGAILYHHENADGSGPFGKMAKETPLFAQLIHFADTLDTELDLSEKNEKKYSEMVVYLSSTTGTLFTKEHVNLFLEEFSEGKFNIFQGTDINTLINEMIPNITQEYSNEDLIHMGDVFAKIIDYKSHFTQKHSIGIANKANIMSKYYGYDKDIQAKLYIAAALHDIGKLVINNDVLEKQDKLTAAEYRYIQNHAWHTYAILSKIHGFEEITEWASLHHEKLNGQGYPFGKTGEELDKNARLLACLDIYQALTEKRPYKESMSHEEAMRILIELSEENAIDRDIVSDIDYVFQNKE